MDFFKQTKYDIYCKGEDDNIRYYMLNKNSNNNKLTIERCNFDTDDRGGLRLVHLSKFEDKRVIDGLTPILTDVSDFIPVEVFSVFLFDEKLCLLNKELYPILTNVYLSKKEFYVLWDGVVEKAKGCSIEDISDTPAGDFTYYTVNLI